MLKHLMIAAATLALTAGAEAVAADAMPEPAKNYLIDRKEEISLSRSAGPAAVSKNATVLVLGEDGEYKTAVEGSNGWTCLTGRAWTGPAPIVDGRRVWSQNAHFDSRLRAPQCFNKESESSFVALHRLTTRMFMNGAAPGEVDAAAALALAAGELKTPELGAMSYMLSPDQYLGVDVGRFMPHLMLYTPYATNTTYGGADEKLLLPVVTDPGTVWAVSIIMMPQWSDGVPATGG